MQLPLSQSVFHISQVTLKRLFEDAQEAESAGSRRPSGGQGGAPHIGVSGTSDRFQAREQGSPEVTPGRFKGRLEGAKSAIAGLGKA